METEIDEINKERLRQLNRMKEEIELYEVMVKLANKFPEIAEDLDNVYKKYSRRLRS